jgi:protease IV
MWSWFLARLKGIFNFFASLIIFLVLLMVVGGVIGAMNTPDQTVPKLSVLELDMRTSVTDTRSTNPFANDGLAAIDIVAALARAENDDRVKGVFMRVGGGSISGAHVEEIRDALASFKAKKKFVIAFSQGFNSNGMGEYWLASAADEIWLQPVSELGTAGIASQAMFFKGLLDKIEAKAEIGQRFEYKNAGAPFLTDDFSPAHREATARLLKSIFDNATTAIAKDRKMTTEQYVALVNSGPHLTQAALDAKLIDKQGYDDDAQDAALDRAGKDSKLVSVKEYLNKAGNPWRKRDGMETSSPIALIEGEGTIIDGDSSEGGFGGGDRTMGGDTVAKAIRDATEDKDVKVILFRVNSPGGSATASDQMLQAVRKAQKAGKKVVVSMGNVAASGGYYVSLSADKIFASPSTITGSIGVLSGKIVLGKSYELLGINVREIHEGTNALMQSDAQGFTPEQWAKLNASLDAIYNDFTAKVAEGRKMPLEKVREVAKGRVWTGVDAKERGLVDELGGFRAALNEAKKLAGLKPEDSVQLKRFPSPMSPAEALAKAFGTTADSVRAMAMLGQLMENPAVKEALTVLREDEQADGAQLRAPREKVQ